MTQEEQRSSPKFSRRQVLGFLGLAGTTALVASCSAAAPAATPTTAAQPTVAPKVTVAAPTGTPESKATTTAVASVASTPTPLPTPVSIAKGNGSQEVLLWHNYTQGDYDAFAKSISDFVGQNPDYKVNADYVPTSSGSQENEKLLTAIAGGKPPDVAEFDRFIVGSFAFRDALNDLTDMAKAAQITADQYLSFAWDEASLFGKLYALPIDTDARALYYRKDFFDAAGIKDLPQTPDQLDTIADKLTVKNGSSYTRFGLIPSMDQGSLYTWGWVWGGEFFDAKTGKVTPDDPKIVEALTWMVGYAKKYGEENMVSFASAFGQGAQSPFVSGQVAMDPNGNWQIAQIKQYAPDVKYDIIAYPHPTGTQATTWSGGWAWTIPKGSKNVESGFTLAPFLTNVEEMGQWCKATSHDPTRVGALKDPAFSSGLQKVFSDLLPTSHYRPVIPEGNLLWNQLASATTDAMYGRGTPQEVLQQVASTVNDQLTKDGWFKHFS